MDLNNLPFEVIYEDNHLVIVNKSAGMLVQGDRTKDIPLNEMVRDYIREKYRKPGNVFCGTVHRLDRPVSGLVVFARTSKALERMSKLFQEREVDKTYLALVSHALPEQTATLSHWMVKNKDSNIVKGYTRKVKDAKLATLRYRMVGRVNKLRLVEVKPTTGRPHQIRVQLAKEGCPIKGDLKYGHPEKNRDASICLHAYKLTFIHPVRKEKVTFRAMPPATEDWKTFQKLLP